MHFNISASILNKSEYLVSKSEFLNSTQVKNDFLNQGQMKNDFISSMQTGLPCKADFISNMIEPNLPIKPSEYITNNVQTKNDFIASSKNDFNSAQQAQISNLSGKADFGCINDNGLSLPPYPSPKGSTCHSRQHSEEFPPPPVDNGVEEEDANKEPTKDVTQNKDGSWLRELQQALRSRKDSNPDANDNQETGQSIDSIPNKSVRDLASRFERTKITANQTEHNSAPNIKTGNAYHQNTYVPQKQQKIAPDQIAEELREVERLNAVVHKTLNKSSLDQNANSNNITTSSTYGNPNSSYGGVSNSISPYTTMNAPLNYNVNTSLGINSSYNSVISNTTPNSSYNSENASHALSNLSTNSTNGSYNTSANNSYNNSYNNESISPCTVSNRLTNTVNYNLNNHMQTDGAQGYSSNNMANAKMMHAATIQNINNEINNMITGTKYPGPNYTNPPKYPGYNTRYTANNLPYGQNGSIHDLDYTNASNIMVVNGGFRNTQNFNNSSANDMTIIGNQVNNTNNVNAVNSNANSNITASSNTGSAGNNIGNNENRTKKKSVSFCDQVILVATADEDEEDGFIPNPILERVLRSANGIQTEAIRLQTQQALARQDSREKLLQQEMQYNNGPSGGYQQQQFLNQFYNQNGRPQIMNPYQQVPSPLTIQAQKAQMAPQVYPQQQNMSNGIPYKSPPQQMPSNYQRVPQPHPEIQNYMDSQPVVASPYQHVPQKHPGVNYPPQMVQQQNCNQQRKKSVSFEPGTKGGCDSPTPKIAIATVNTNTAIVKASAKAVICNLCRKKHVVAPNVYCGDCDFYMARFRPRT